MLRPGGSLVILDAFPPRGGLFARLLSLWLNCVVPFLASVLTRQRKAYSYLATSIQQTIAADAVADVLRAAGCETVQVTSYSFGAAARIVATKPGAAQRAKDA